MLGKKVPVHASLPKCPATAMPPSWWWRLARFHGLMNIKWTLREPEADVCAPTDAGPGPGPGWSAYCGRQRWSWLL